MREIERIVQDYDAGRLNRRQLIAALTGLVAMGCASGAPPSTVESTFKAVGLNHIALRVADIARSRDFYSKHLGLRQVRGGSTSSFLTFGTGFLALFRGEPGLHHYCFSVDGYSVEDAARKLRQAGIEPDIQGQRIYFPDPDGLIVQLAAPDHQA
ncbi:MAG: hypothetical protein Kow001_09720 [Acidobacteriota bacterium]